MRTVQAARRAQVIVLGGDGLPETVGRVSAEVGAQLQVAPDAGALREMVDPVACAARGRVAEGDGATVVVIDDQGAVESTEALVGEILRLRPSLKVVYVSDRLDPVREIELRLKGVYFLIARPVEDSLLKRVLAKAIEHETTRWKRNGR